MPKSLSALIIAKDEERDLPGCLESLEGLADEIVVLVDAATTDETTQIAAAAGAKFHKRAFDDYARQRQAALELCTKEWVLWIDADERVDEALRASLRSALEKPDAEAYPIRFDVVFLGKTLRWGGYGHEKHVRLFRRDKTRFVGGQLHEGLAVDGTVGRPLAGRMKHEPYKSISEYLSKLDRYTTLAAEKKWAAGVRFRPWHHLVLPGQLGRRLLFQLAFLDGFAGVALSVLSGFHHWLKYAKLKEMERKP